MTAITIGRRFTGPEGSANGGYTCGLLAGLVGEQAGAAPVTVTLRRPPPLDVPMDVERLDDGGLRLSADGALVAEASPAAGSAFEVVDPVDYAVTTAAAAGYRGLTAHPFPACFVCGVDRPAGDGMDLRPGPVPDRPGTTACPWTPQPSLPHEEGKIAPEIVWAALDCPGGWTIDQPGRPAVLGRLRACVDDRPHVGERCVVMGALLREEGRKSFTATTLYDSDGRILARAEAVWIALRP